MAIKTIYLCLYLYCMIFNNVFPPSFPWTDARVRSLAAAWARHDHELSDWLLSQRERFGLVEVLKAATLLDAGRCIRVQEKKMKRLQMQTNGRVKPRVMGKHKSTIDNLKAMKPKVRREFTI